MLMPYISIATIIMHLVFLFPGIRKVLAVSALS